MPQKTILLYSIFILLLSTTSCINKELTTEVNTEIDTINDSLRLSMHFKENCCQWEEDTIIIHKPEIEIQISTKGGLCCDPHIRELIILKNNDGSIKAQYLYNSVNLSNPIMDRFGIHWRNRPDSNERLLKYIETHLKESKKIN